MKRTTIFATGLIASLGACDSPTPPSITYEEVLAIEAEAERIRELPDTAIADLPTGTSTYQGYVGADVSGDAEGSVIGNMEMIVHFASGNIGGTIDNVNLLDEDGVPTQLLGGSLEISGSENSGLLNASANGTLSAVGEESVRGSSTVDLTMTGNVLTDTADGDSIAGDLSGSGDGDFYISIFNGGFVGTED